MKKITSYLGVFLAASVMLASSLAPVIVSAASPTSSGLSIAPRKNYTINPGDTIKDKLTINNIDPDSDLDLGLSMVDFTFMDSSGTPKLNLDSAAEPTTWSLRPFTTLPKSILIPAGESKTIDYSITLPKNQGAGSYYSAIVYSSGGANGNNLNLNASGVTLAFVTVPGKVSEKLTLNKLGAYQTDNGGVTGKFVFIATSNMPQRIGYNLKNEGNVTESPVGSMTIKNIFGKEVAKIDNINVNGSLALIGQDRLFLSCIKEKPLTVDFKGETTKTTDCDNPNLKPGIYRVSLAGFYGQNGNMTQEITGSTIFFYLPWWFIVAVLVALLVIGYYGYKIYRKFKNRSNNSGFKRRR